MKNYKTPCAAGLLIKEYCDENEISKRSLSLSVGASEKYVSDIISGQNQNPDHKYLRDISDVTGIPYEDLSANDNAPHSGIRTGGFMIDVIALVDKSDTKESRKKDITDDVKHLCGEWLKRDTGSVPADPKWVREKFSEWAPATFNVSQKRFSNIKSSIKAALEIAGVIPGDKKPIRQVDPEWRKLYDAVAQMEKHSKKSWLAPALSPFIRFCDGENILPRDVSDETINAFAAYRDAYDLSGDISKKITSTRTAWNNAVENVPGWPAVKLSAGLTREFLNLPTEDFLESFQEDLRQYDQCRGMHPSHWSQSASRIDRVRRKREIAKERGRKKELKPLGKETVKSHVKTIKLFASAAVRTGMMDVEDIHTLADVVDVGVVAEVIEKDVEPRLGSATSYAGNLVKQMKSVATRWILDISADELMDFSELRGDVEINYKHGSMSEKDRKRLAPFLSNMNNMSTLVSFPVWVIEDAERVRKKTKSVRIDMAHDVQTAIMCIIEQTLPVRVGDLRKTLITGNIIWPTMKGGQAILHYHPGKNGGDKSLQAPLVAWKTQLLEIYIKHYLPVLRNDPANPYLFPGLKDGEPKSYSAVSRQCGRLIKVWTGHTVNMHLWRKLMGGYLLAQTKNMELVEDLLGHVRGSDATKVYTEMQSAWAVAELDVHVSRLMSGAIKKKHTRPNHCKWLRS